MVDLLYIGVVSEIEKKIFPNFFRFFQSLFETILWLKFEKITQKNYLS